MVPETPRTCENAWGSTFPFLYFISCLALLISWDGNRAFPCEWKTPKTWEKKKLGSSELEAGTSDTVPRCALSPGELCPSPGELCQPCPSPAVPRVTFVQDRPEDGQAVVDGGAVPAAAPELVLALLDAQLDALGHAGHDLDVVAAEAELLGHQAGDGAAEDGLGAQGAVLLAQGQGPAGTGTGTVSGLGTPPCLAMPCPGATNNPSPAPSVPRGS